MILAALAALALAAEPQPLPAPADAAPSTAQPPGPRTVAGKIGLVALAESRLTLEASDGTLPLVIDRNTLVFLETQLGTARDLAPGMPARISVAADGRAVWIELRPRGVVPTPSR